MVVIDKSPCKERKTMQARMNNPAMILPQAMQALLALSEATENARISPQLREMIHLRASQINGCSVCVDMHAKGLKRSGETEERIFAVAAWRDAPCFTDAERAALALTEAVTRLSDRPDPVPDDLWAEAAAHFDEQGIALINLWNRLNVATRQVAGAWEKSSEARKWVETGTAAAR
jgi:AhpD family alkylhydroperoxidase